MNHRRQRNDVKTKGLINKPGENNCFINSVIQLLWHTRAFRENFLRVNFHTTCDELVRFKVEAKIADTAVLSNPVELDVEEVIVMNHKMQLDGSDGSEAKGDTAEVKPTLNSRESIEADTTPEDITEENVVIAVESEKVFKRCMVCAIQNLFIMYRYSAEATLPPTVVRNVLSDVFEEGRMHSVLDSLEFLLQKLEEKNLYALKIPELKFAENIEYNGDPDTLDIPDEEKETFLNMLESKKVSFVDVVFSHSFLEVKKCSCGATSEPFVARTKFLHIAVNDLLAYHMRIQEKLRKKNFLINFIEKKAHFSKVLHKCLTQGTFDCPQFGKDCKSNRVVQENSLLELPKTFCLTFNWISEFAGKGTISEMARILSTELDLTKLFSYSPDIKKFDKKGGVYTLTAAISYYGRHYTAYVYHSKKRQWVYCDDSNVRVIGSWKQVVQHVVRSTHQLELLIYSSYKPDFVKA